MQLPNRDALAQGWLEFFERKSQPGRLAMMGQIREFGEYSSRSHERMFGDFTASLDECGNAVLARIAGEFCAAYISPDSRSTILYRSVTAPWPLCYRIASKALIWSTDPSFTYPVDELRNAVLSDALPSLLLQDRYSSYLENVEVLSPGCCLKLTPRGIERSSLDKLSLYDLREVSVEEAAKGLSERTSQSIESLISPSSRVSVALSGGIDSAVVLSEAIRLVGGISAFHCTLPPTARRLDLTSARQVAKTNGVPLTEIDLSPFVGQGGGYAECEPSCRAFHLHLGAERELLRAAAEQVERPVLMLSGLFSDDLFGGVPADRMSLNPLSLDSFWRGAAQLLAARSGSELRIARSVVTGLLRPASGILPIVLPFLQTFGGPLLKPDAREAAIVHCLDAAKDVEETCLVTTERCTRLDRMQATALSIVALQSHSIIQGGIACERYIPPSTAWLTPFMDRRLVEYCLSLPQKFRSGSFMGDRIDKVIWRYTFSDRAPAFAVRQQLGNVFNNAGSAFIENNVARVAAVLNPDCALHAIGVIDGNQAACALKDPLVRAKYGHALLYAYRLERWLTRLSNDHASAEGVSAGGRLVGEPWERMT
ncbi:MAG TPA: asparagine synthase-related protein [Kineosporiaceae bacterium]